MKKIILLLLLPLFLASCPHNTPGPAPLPTDPYAVARAVIQGAELAVLGADGVFEITMAFTDPAKVPDLRKQYLKIRASVIDGLRVALDGVNLAESQKAGFDLGKLMAQAETAYQDLLKFINGLKSAPSTIPAVTVPVPEMPKLPPSLLPPAKK